MAATVDTRIMEAYSLAYVHALAASAGVSTQITTPDINSLDVGFLSRDNGDQAGSSSHVQLKTTMNELPQSSTRSDCVSFRLKSSDYDHLRKVTTVPRVLVVLQIPEDPSDWVDCQPEHIVMVARALYVSLRGLPADSAEKPRVDIPKSQRFTTETLLSTMVSLDAK